MRKRIGIDIDDTILNTTLIYDAYQQKYCNENNIAIEKLKDDSNLRHEFMKKYYKEIYTHLEPKKNSIEVINKLYEKFDIYIITARNAELIPEIKKITEDTLNGLNLKYNYLIFTGRSKLKACKENNIELMIDDNIEIYNELRLNDIKVLLFDEESKYIQSNTQVNNWNQLYCILGQL